MLYIGNKEPKGFYFDNKEVLSIYYNNVLLWPFLDESSSWDVTPGIEVDAEWFNNLKDFVLSSTKEEIEAKIPVGTLYTVTLNEEVLGTTTHNIKVIGICQDGDHTITFLTSNCLAQATQFGSSAEWIGSTVRAKCQEYYNAFPGKAAIRTIKKGVAAYSTSRNGNVTYNDETVFLLSEREYGLDALSSLSTANSTTAKAECTQGYNESYLAYTDKASRIKKNGDNGSAQSHWERSRFYYNSSYACYVNNYGTGDYSDCGSICYLAPAFVIGETTVETNIFGVMWNYANSSTALTRLTTSNDPHGYVTVNITSNPVAAVGTGVGNSPFDDYLPWSGMEEYNIIGSTVGPKQGESGFSRTSNDVMVYIPEFWYKCIDDATNSKRYWYIANGEVEGFEKHPGSEKYVARYSANSSYNSVSGSAELSNITRSTARNNVMAKGSGWHLYDFSSLCAVQLLYLVEFADWDSQAKIGRGYVDGNSAYLNTGKTDGMTYHTGRAAGTDGKTAIQYRYIENPWGNMYQFVDGINFNNRRCYVCTNYSEYADDIATNYSDTGVDMPSSNGYIKSLGYSSTNSWVIIPNESGGSDNTYIPDRVYVADGWTLALTRGSNSETVTTGLFYSFFGAGSSSLGSHIGVRTLYSPHLNG